MKDGIIFINSSGVPKASLVKLLVELEVLRVLPVSPIVLLDQVAVCEAHDACGVVVYIAKEDNVIASGTQDSGTVIEEFDGIVELVMCVLGEVFLGHDGDTVIGDVWSDLWVQEEECT